jgi:two-component system NtrC family sensor kinase
VCIAINDSGQGISSEHLPRIFEPFFTTKEHGSGLGLSISYELIKALGGDITVSSQMGSGTTFSIRLPLDSEK